MEIATGLVGGLEALARGAGVTGFGVERRSTGLAGGPVPTSFGCVSDDRGFCGEQGVSEVGFLGHTSLLSGTPCLLRMGCGGLGSERCNDALEQHNTHLGRPSSPLEARALGQDSGVAAGVP